MVKDALLTCKRCPFAT